MKDEEKGCKGGKENVKIRNGQRKFLAFQVPAFIYHSLAYSDLNFIYTTNF
jgi:hypothetical protein